MGDMSESQVAGITAQDREDRADYCNEAVFRRNCLPGRSYYIPNTSLLLNGSWDFHLASTPLEAPEPTEAKSLDWSNLSVPGHWQLQGHGRPWYTNTQFPIPVCPPFVPTENPTGTYHRSFYVPSTWSPNSQLRLRFDGVDSAYHVWVNCALVGYAQGSRNPAEFDVSQPVKRDGANELFVRVYQWSDATYIEDQDQWWLSGIFRDVHLIAFPTDAAIKDWFLRTDFDTKYEDAKLHATVDVLTQEPARVQLTLLEQDGNGGHVVTSTEASVRQSDTTIELILDVLRPEKWTAETPYLYSVEICLTTDLGKTYTVNQRIGFRKIELKEGLMTVNGKPIRLRGVNRHEHHPLFGRAVPLEFAKADLLLMKTHNINALRCAHQPNDPRILELCDELGFWVMDEADLECHGFYDAIARPLDIPEENDYEERKQLTFPPAAKFTSGNPAWKAAYVDRMTALVQRDKNCTSVIMWSLGNEAFYGDNHKAMYEYANQVDPGRLIHYEGDTHAETAHMYSYMYPSPDRLARLAKEEGVEDGRYEKPIVLCEYAHAMGNGPGRLEDYEELFRKYPRLQGGFIWEWANHGLWKETEGEPGYYARGGDFGEYPHDGAFVMDGLVNSAHEPTPGLVEFKKVIQPVGISLQDGKIVIENRYDFLTLDHLTATFKVEKASLIASGTLLLPCVKAGYSVTVDNPASTLKYKSCDDVFLLVSFALKTSTSWADAGHEVAWSQHQLHALASPSTRVGPRLDRGSSKINISSVKSLVTVTGGEFTFVFDRARGGLKSWAVNGRTLLEADPSSGLAIIPSFWRSPTDNDVPVALPYWKRFGVHALTSQLRSFSVDTSHANKVTLKVHTFIAPPVLAWGLECEAEYTVTDTGALHVNIIRLTPTGSYPDQIPRIGLNLRLRRVLDHVHWYGRGPGESYPDKGASQRMGIWHAKSLADLQTPYDIPQENGNRMGTRWTTMSSGESCRWGIRATRSGDKSFDFAASHHSAQALEEAAHPHELIDEDATLLRLDVKTAGLGTASCGPGVKTEFLVPCEETSFGFVLESL